MLEWGVCLVSPGPGMLWVLTGVGWVDREPGSGLVWQDPR